MKMRKLFAGIGLASLLLASCIQDEALNKEAAIDGCTGTYIQQATIDSYQFTIQLYVSRAANPSSIEIDFKIPYGATIAPVSAEKGDHGSFYDFSKSKTREFEVISEDQAFRARYSITVHIDVEMPERYSFETLNAINPYHVFYEQYFEEVEGEEEPIRYRLEWASGNPGYNLTSMANSPLDFPTVQVDGGWKNTKAVKLTTCDTGSFGEGVHMPIAAGNLFIGDFDLANALKAPRQATHFGFPFFKKPIKLEGYYKFKRGAIFSENGQAQPGKQDECDIYGVFYETDDQLQTLDGDNSLTSDRIVSIARFHADSQTSYLPESESSYLPETNEWTKFELPFVLKNGKSIDKTKLEEGKYKLAIVFSSSVDGAFFKGAIGSTLHIDEVKLTTENVK